MASERFDKVIIGAGLYGLYSALFCCKRCQKVLVLECEPAPFRRATYINQARVHQGYHYPRSLSTAIKTADYFERFNKDYGFCINSGFEQIYAISDKYSWSNGKQFKDFCKAAGIPCEELHPDNYFKEGMCDAAFRTREYTYDALVLKDYMLNELAKCKNLISIVYNVKINNIDKNNDTYIIKTSDGRSFESGFVLNASYAGTNQILNMAGFEQFNIKYELCEIILCEANDKLKGLGFTVMDGPFFSIMPFGKSGCHSLTSVTFTPHETCSNRLPEFECQKKSGGTCSVMLLGNCNECQAKPKTAFPFMSGLAKKYLNDEYEFSYKCSLFAMKPILMSSELDDSRPTVIRRYSSKPDFFGLLSGKINTVYDLDEVLADE